MECIIKKFIKVERGNFPPCFDIIAIGIRSEDDLFVDLEDYDYYYHTDYLPPRFEKRLCPPTMAQAEELEKKCITDSMGNVIGDFVFIRLMSYEWKTPFPFYRINPKSVTGVYEVVECTTESEEEHENMKLITKKIRYIPEVFSSIKLTLFETADGKCAENGGDVDGLCRKTFNNAVMSGIFLLQKNAVDIREVIKYKKEWMCKDDEMCDDWKDSYNWEYYNDGLDMDQQDERFWNF